MGRFEADSFDSEQGPMAGCFECGVYPSCYISVWEFIDCSSDVSFSGRSLAPWI